jgi:hypothetical protein
MNPKVVAYYLPQFHRTKENDEWWGIGFTEWTNVAAARPLFKGHYQPKIPTELGFYDLRFTEVREAQAELARRAGVTAFCYWHYWLGNGKKLLNYPLDEVVRLKKPDFPFCLAWANHSWYKKHWATDYSHLGQMSSKSILLMEQTYPGLEDIDAHFYDLLDKFKDDRYLRIDGRLLFVIFAPLEIPNWILFRDRWQELAAKEGLPGFYFVAHTCEKENIDMIRNLNFDAINYSTHHEAFSKANYKAYHKLISKVHHYFSIKPQIVEYSDAIEKMKSQLFRDERIFPTIVPNWDHTPRSGFFGRCYNNCTPELFRVHVNYILDMIKDKKEENQVIFLKSWNEWGEGNYMEPDIKYGDGHIRILRECLDHYQPL